MYKKAEPAINPAVLTIEPAGENLVGYAYVNNDRSRSFGRTGIRAV